MKKAAFVLLTAIMLASMFVAVKQAKAISNGMCMNPVQKVVDPPMDGSDLTFTWDLNISTGTAVSAWEATLLWDPSVLACLGYTYGTFMTPGTAVGNATPILPQTKVITLGQYYSVQGYTSTGDGVLATIKFTFILPGVTTLYIIEAKIWDDSLNEYNLLPPTGDTLNGELSSNRPHPSFTWKTADGINPCPNSTSYDQGRSYPIVTPVTFNGSLSYDVGNVHWSGSAWVKDGGYPDTVAFRWEYGDGYYDYYTGGNYSTTTTHAYASYNKAGWLVNMTVWDSEGEWWSTTWRYGGPDPANTVPMWRDIAIVDLWPSLPPYELWDEEGIDWGEYWSFDSVNFWVPNTNDPYWNYKVDFPSYGYPPNTTVKNATLVAPPGEGLYVLVTANNFGSTPEKVRVTLYAIYLRPSLKIAPPPPKAMFATSVEKIGQWSNTLQPGTGTGWNDYTVWIPSKNGTYLLFATIEAAQDTEVHDCDLTNNYMLLSTPICSEAVWDKATLTLKTDSIFTQYLCDITGNGKVGPEDFSLLSANFGAKPPK